MENLLLFDLNLDGVDPIYLKDVANVFIKDNSDEVYAKLMVMTALCLHLQSLQNRLWQQFVKILKRS